MSDQERVCLHGSLRRQCEPCDLAARLEAAEAEIARLKAPPDHERLRAIAEREQRATKGAWRFVRFNRPRRGESYPDEILKTTAVAATYPGHQIRTAHTGGVSPTFDAEFIAHAREDVPYLLSLVARQAQEIAQLQADRDAFHMDYRIKSDQQSKAALVRAEQAESEVSRQAQEIQDLRARLASALAEREEALLSIGGVQSDLRKAEFSRDALREALKQICALSEDGGYKLFVEMVDAVFAETPTEDQR